MLLGQVLLVVEEIKKKGEGMQTTQEALAVSGQSWKVSCKNVEEN